MTCTDRRINFKSFWIDWARLPEFQHRWVVFIGDFVDRGPDPRRSLKWFSILPFNILERRQSWATTNLPCARRWAGFLEARGRFGVSASGVVAFTVRYRRSSRMGRSREILLDLAAKVPPAHREFLVNLPWCVEHPQLLFVHAGLDPNIPFNVQLHNSSTEGLLTEPAPMAVREMHLSKPDPRLIARLRSSRAMSKSMKW